MSYLYTINLVYSLETPVDVTCQDKKGEPAVFTARLSEKGKKGQWFLRNEVSHILK